MNRRPLSDPPPDRTVDVVVVGHDHAACAAAGVLRGRGADVALVDDRWKRVWAVTPTTRLDGQGRRRQGQVEPVDLVVDLAVDGVPDEAIGCRAVVSALSAHATVPLLPGGHHAGKPGDRLDGDTLLAGGHLGAICEALRHGTPREVWLPFSRAALTRHLLRAPSLLRIGGMQVLRDLASLRRRGVPVRFGTSLARLEPDGEKVRAHRRGSGKGTPLTVRRVVVADSRTPPSELPRSAGAGAAWDAALGGWLVTNQDAFLLPVLAAGAAAGIQGAAGLAAHGLLVGDEVATMLGLAGSLPTDHRAAATRAVRQGRELARWHANLASCQRPIGADTVVCPCEGVTVGALEAVGQLLPDPATLRDVKTLTRAGMGPCQGRHCASAVAAWAELSGRVAAQLLDAGFRPRLPLAPLVLREPAAPVPISAVLLRDRPDNDRSSR